MVFEKLSKDAKSALLFGRVRLLNHFICQEAESIISCIKCERSSENTDYLRGPILLVLSETSSTNDSMIFELELALYFCFDR